MLNGRTVPGAAALPPAGWVLAGGITAGTLDILFAWAFWAVKAGLAMQRILQSVAAGLLGAATYKGGAATAALGLGLHFFIAIAMSGAYYVVARRWRLLVRRPLLCGAGYGLALYGVMNYVVIPLSAASRGSRDPLWIGSGVAVHALLVGIPIALASRQARARPEAAGTGV
jgi:hypothetical protein